MSVDISKRNSLNVLTLGPNASVMRPIGDSLRALGHYVTDCEDARVAWRYFRRFGPSVVIIGGDAAAALTLCRRFQEKNSGSTLVLAVVPRDADPRPYLEAGADDILLTPFNIDDATCRLAVIENWARRKRDDYGRDIRRKLITMLWDQCHDAFFVIDPENAAVIDVNEKACANLGYTRTGLLSLPFTAVDPAYPDEVFWREHVKALRRGAGASLSLPGMQRRHDGSALMVETDFVYVEQDNRAFVLALVRDLPWQDGMAVELSTTRARLQQLLNMSPGIIYSAAAGGDFAINYISPNIKQYLGYEPADWLGRCDFWLENIHPDDKSRVLDGLPHLFENGRHAHEYRFRAVDGRYHWFYDEMKLLRDEHGNTLEIIGYAMEITERKLAERELMLAKEAAEEANKVKADFLAGVTHELRTPLNAVVGFSDLLRHGTDLDGEQRAYVEHINKAADILEVLINDILDYAKLEAGQPNFLAVPFDFEMCVHEAVDMVAAEAEKKGLELAVGYVPEAPRYFIGDPNRLRQVVINLAANALKFTDKGHVLISVDEDRRDGDNVWMTLTVEDTGIGIPKDQYDRIFQRFTQVDASTSRRFGGVGLGLAIVRQLVRLMGGTIELDSVVGKGSRFHLRLPMTIDAHRFEAGVEKFSLDGKRVLIVGDQPLSMAIIRQHLKSWRGHVETAATNSKALQTLMSAAGEGHPVNFLIILDGPGADATALSHQVRAEPLLHETLSVKVCTADRECRIDSLKQAGVSACIVRPINPMRLRKVLESVCLAWDCECDGELTRDGAAGAGGSVDSTS